MGNLLWEINIAFSQFFPLQIGIYTSEIFPSTEPREKESATPRCWQISTWQM